MPVKMVTAMAPANAVLMNVRLVVLMVRFIVDSRLNDTVDVLGNFQYAIPARFKLPDPVTEDYGQFFLRAMMSKDDKTGAVMCQRRSHKMKPFT